MIEALEQKTPSRIKDNTMAIAPNAELSKLKPMVPVLDENELRRKNRAAMELLDAWDHDVNEQDQCETMKVIREALGKDRIGSNRALFP